MTNPHTPSLFVVALKVGCKDPDSKQVNRKEFVFSGFENRKLADQFENQLKDFLGKFIIRNAETHDVIQEHLWLVRPVHCETEEEIKSQDISLDPSENFESILEKILQCFKVSQEAPA